MDLLILLAVGTVGATADPSITVAPGGALLLDNGSIAVSSIFSEGTHLHSFNLTVAQGDNWLVEVVRKSLQVVLVTGKASSFVVKRLYTLESSGRVLVNDTVIAADGMEAVVGVQIRHRAWSPSAVPIRGVSGPNTLRASSCATNGITGQLKFVQNYGSTVGLDAGTGGNPTVYAMFGSKVGVGLVALDDVFVAHSETANRAGPVDAFTNTRACQLLRSTPPSVELADPHFGLAAGASHTLEWAVRTVHITPSLANDSDVAPPGYWTFINQVRADSGVSGRITIPKLGPMGAFQAGLLRTDNYSATDWTKWTRVDTQDIVRRNGIAHIISQMPRAQFESPCGLQPTVAFGSGFVHENTSTWDNYFRQLVAKVNEAEGDAVRVLAYFHAFISGERHAAEKYPDDRILNYEGQQLNYSHCSAMPLFYPMLLPNGSANKYGQQLYAYLDKAKALGARGIYHDESGFSVIPYTFHPGKERWDGVTVAFDKSFKALPAPPFLSSIPLLRLGFKIDFMDRVGKMFGARSAIANGQPMTRSYVQAQLDSRWSPTVHFAETSQQCRVKQTHTYTPIGGYVCLYVCTYVRMYVRMCVCRYECACGAVCRCSRTLQRNRFTKKTVTDPLPAH